MQHAERAHGGERSCTFTHKERTLRSAMRLARQETPNESKEGLVTFVMYGKNFSSRSRQPARSRDIPEKCNLFL